MKRKIFPVLLCAILICMFFVIFCYEKQKNTIAVIGAMDEEIAEFFTSLKHPKTTKSNNFTIITGTLGNNNIVLTKSGVGKVASAATTQFIIDKYRPKYIINTGIAGSLSNDLNAGSIILANRMVQHDFDVTAFGNPKGYIDNGIEPDKPTIFHSDRTLIDKFKKELEAQDNTKVIIGTIATGDIFVNKKEQKIQIKKEFSADATDMESAAIAQTAQINNVPLLVIRTISDSENDSVSEYKRNKETSATKAAFAIISVLGNK